MMIFRRFIEKARIAAMRLATRQALAEGKSQRLDEHKLYQNFPGEKTSFRIDPGNTSTVTQRHAHIFAKPEGKGKQLYSVNIDGTGHDGSSGTTISSSHASFLREKGFVVPTTNILEQLDPPSLEGSGYSLILLIED
jgi:hypothetical protein